MAVFFLLQAFLAVLGTDAVCTTCSQELGELSLAEQETDEVNLGLLQTAYEVASLEKKISHRAMRTNRSWPVMRAVTEINRDAYEGKWFLTMGTDNVLPGLDECIYMIVDKLIEPNPGFMDYRILCTPEFSSRRDYYSLQDPEKPAGEFEVRETMKPVLVDTTPFRGPNYLMVSLGPIVNGSYEYEVGVRPADEKIYVWSRDPQHFYAQYMAQVIQDIKDLGYTGNLKTLAKHPCECDEVPEADAHIPRVDEFDIDAYLGQWYLVMANPSVHDLYAEMCGVCVHSYYEGLNESFGWKPTHTTCTCAGAVVNTGYSAANPSITGDFQVRLGVEPLPPQPFVYSNYVIVALGPIVDGHYDYDVVTTPGWERLYIRTRDVSRFFRLYADEVKEKLRAMGFDQEFWTVTTEEGCDCE